MLRFVLCVWLFVLVALPGVAIAAELAQDGVFCYGRLLDMVQMSRIFPDSKHFVDMPLKRSPEETIAAFDRAFPPNSKERPAPENLSNFVNEWFAPLGSDIIEFSPEDWTETPQLFKSLKDPNVLRFAGFLNQQWKDLGRKHVDSIKTNPELYSAVGLPHEFIVAGGRFREMYYWDSYWIVKGQSTLTLCESWELRADHLLA
jgi:alpha,alpha-trehalase